MTTSGNALLAVERQRNISKILEREGVVRTAELCELLGVSAVTVRSDLRDLESAGVCELIWGGAVSRTPPTEAETQVEQRSTLNQSAKQRIGAKAASLVQSGQTIILDAGTTTVELIHHLPPDLDYLRVITPALNVAIATATYPYIELIMPGGVLRNLTHSLIGPQTLQSLQMFNADLAFIASGGFSLDHGVTTSNIMEVEVKRAIVRQAASVILLADSSKFGQVLSLNVTPLSGLDTIISDSLLSDADAAAIESQGVEVMRV